jgi:16S rRNA (cytidine1402-2'-O)-methyltransferase
MAPTSEVSLGRAQAPEALGSLDAKRSVLIERSEGARLFGMHNYNGHMSTLYIVSTPIGNLADITLRALETLKSVDLVLCEDTRVTRTLLSRYDISIATMSYHAQSSTGKHEHIIELLREGKNLALVSDAGTPTVSDPGVMLVAQVREQLPEVSVVPIPGASAMLAALVSTGFPSAQFLYLGFLPHKKGRETMFREIAECERTVVVYESPHRIMKALESLAGVLQDNRRIAVCRELTKMFEEVKIGPSKEVLEYYKTHPDKVRGEFVIVIEGK